MLASWSKSCACRACPFECRKIEITIRHLLFLMRFTITRQSADSSGVWTLDLRTSTSSRSRVRHSHWQSAQQQPLAQRAVPVRFQQRHDWISLWMAGFTTEHKQRNDYTPRHSEIGFFSLHTACTSSPLSAAAITLPSLEAISMLRGPV